MEKMGTGMEEPSRYWEAVVVLAGGQACEPSPEVLRPKDLMNKQVM